MEQDENGQDENDRRWSNWAAINVVTALTDAGLLTVADEAKAQGIVEAQLFELLTTPRRWAAAFPGKTEN
jgi:hypothetical protein